MSEVAHRLGLAAIGRHRWGPCPVCSAERDSSGRRGTLHRDRHGTWWCNSCGENLGDDVGLAYHHLGSWRAAFRLVEGGDAGTVPRRSSTAPAPVPEDVERYPPSDLLAAELERGRPLADAPPAVHDWLRSRGLDEHIAALYLPQSRLMKRGYPVVVPMYTTAGQLRSIHGRAVDGRAQKTSNVAGYSSRSLVFADPRVAAPWLRGALPHRLRTLVLVEGVTDYLTTERMRGDRHVDVGVMGIVSGSCHALADLTRRLERAETQVVYIPDCDRAGRVYRRRIAAAIYPVPVHPVPLARLQPLR